MSKIGFLVSAILKHIPSLGIKLRTARLGKTKEQFISRVLWSSTLLAAALTAYFVFFLKGNAIIIALPVFIVFWLGLFFYFMRMPDMVTYRRAKDIDREIVFAVRFLIIEVQSGVPTYDALLNLSRNYKTIGSYVSEIVHQVNLGTSLDDALKDAVDIMPSKSMKRVLWQILNSINTGSDMAVVLSAILDQVVREQHIEVVEYGRKLNPIAMLYLMMAIVIPSIGTAMFIVISIFIGIQVTLPILLVIIVLMAFVQFMFLQMIRISRPAVDV